MTTLQVTSEINIEVEKVLDGIARLNTPELEDFLSEVSILLARRKAPSLSKREAELLQKINQGLPETVQKRYDELSEKLHLETITPEEHKELLKLVDTTELANAERIEYLLELAGLRKVSLNELIRQLGIKPPPVHA